MSDIFKRARNIMIISVESGISKQGSNSLSTSSANMASPL